MPSLWNNADEAAIKNRISQLLPSSPRMWGTMSVDQMMQHLSIAYNSASGKITLPSEGFLAKIASLKPSVWLMLYVMPWPKNLPTAKSFLAVDSHKFDAAQASLMEAFKTFMASKSTHQFGEHPLFGKLSFEDWGVLLYKHTDHHLKQFGV